MGRIVPNQETHLEVPSPHDGRPVTVPCGELRDISEKKNHKRTNERFTLNYNEYIVYNVNQVKMRYILKIKFHF